MSRIKLPEPVGKVLEAETRAAELPRSDNLPDMSIVYLGKNEMSVGQGGDGKQLAGDRRTPLGIYIVTKQRDTVRMHEECGILASVLDYPDVLDNRYQCLQSGRILP